ncbi:hypothetical protein [Flavobacterium sp. CLA17]|uniref:hypothetical protein n=1 Tax=Flavobacterium sp. CLA17 TaxID=2724135 RepID=UPI0019682233|nr:hypothetical protein [Flavobacterium sp. CLA17]QSB26570.1 hypothetical protein HAV12_019745 [Flavobacterium sp. CLA17]
MPRKRKEDAKMKINKSMLLVILLLITVSSVSQNKTEEKLLVNDFVKAVFFEKNTAKSIADSYIYFEPINNTKYSLSQRVKILDKHLKKIKEEKSSLLDAADFYVITYNDYKGDKVVFEKRTDNVFILVSKNKPIMYFSLINDKIISFDYIIKGNEGLFISY